MNKTVRIIAGRTFEVSGALNAFARELLDLGTAEPEALTPLIRRMAAIQEALVLLNDGHLDEEALLTLNYPHRMQGKTIP